MDMTGPLNRFCEGEVDGDLRQAINIVGEAHDINEHEQVDECGILKAESEEVVQQGIVNGAFVLDGGMDDAVDDLPLFFGMGAGANQQGVLLFPAILDGAGRVRSETVFAAIELGDDEVDAFAVTGMEGVFGLAANILHIRGEGVRGVADGRVKIGHFPHLLLELVEYRFCFRCDLVVGGNCDWQHSII